jgi:CHRD domain
LADLDHRHPIVFFPIRIETKYHKPVAGVLTLRIRFYPDQITVNNFDPRLTRKEIDDARNYWKVVGVDIDKRNSAWIKLANQHGLARAAYISKSVIHYDPDIEPDPIAPSLKADNEIPIREIDDNLAATCQLLPNRFEVYGKFKNSSLDSITSTGRDVPESLQLNPLQNVDPDSSKWVIDFQAALEVGMGIEINLTPQQYASGFDYIIAYGVRDSPPDKTKQQIENLFTAHRYTNGLRLVKQGTPTNLVKERSKDVKPFLSHQSSAYSDSISYRSIEFQSLDVEQEGQVSLHSPDGRVLERALGLDNVSNGLLNANNYDQLTAACMSSALWPSVLGYFMDKFANIPILNNEKLQEHFVKYVSAQGIIPPICVGKIPYGILPITGFSEWEDNNLLMGTDHIRTFFADLMIRWTDFVDRVPTISNNNGDPTKNLIDILSMEAVSHTYNVRGFRSLNYIADFIFEILNKKKPNGEPIVTSQNLVVKNKLLLDILLKLTFPFIPDGSLERFYEQCPGNGISQVGFPLVSQSEKEVDPPPDYIEKIYQDIKGTERNFLKTTKDQMDIDSTKPLDSDPLLLRLLRYSASLIGEKDDQKEIEKFLEALEILRKINPDRLKTLMLQTLDLVSYRLDAWVTSFANQRLDHLRQTTTKGLYAGAFGWIVNLMPRELQSAPEGGYIQAPSYAHATASAVLRNGYITHSDEPEKKDLLKININSERTKNALEIINSIRSTPLPELLGYKLERRLHDAKLDYLIDEFRKHFPLNKEDIKKLEDNIEDGQERILPRNLTDGLVVFKNWKRLVESTGLSDIINIKNFMETDQNVPGWKLFYTEIKNNYAANDEDKILLLITQLKPELNFLLEQMDGLSDLCLAESVFQAVRGNYSRSGAVLEGMSGDGQIPDPEISLIPRSGLRLIQRIALAFEAQPLENLILRDTDDTVSWINPRKLVEPNLDKIIKSSIGAISFWIDLKDTSGNIISTEELGLGDLGLEAIDLIYIENSELDSRLNFYAKSRGFINYTIRYEREDSTPENIEKKSLTDLQFMINALRELVAQGHPLNFSDFQTPNEIVQKELQLRSIKEIFQRYYDALLLLIQTLDELESTLGDDTELGIKKKKQALFKVGLFASEFAVLINPKGNVIDLATELNERIGIAIGELKSRLPKGNDQAAKLLEWKSRLEAEGEEAFLESIVNEFSVDSQNDREYLKAIEVLTDQIKIILNIKTFLILPTFTVPSDSQLKSSLEINDKVQKWIEKISYVRPHVKLLDEIITYNQILESSDFSFYCDEAKFMKSPKLFNAHLSGQQEVPPVNTQAIGIVEFTRNGENVDYMIKATNIEGVTAGHIHSGVEGENGPIVVSLFKFDVPQNEISKSGTITADMLEGPMNGKTIADLTSDFKNGSIYANLQTEQNPNGEIRGQILVNEKEEVNPVSLILVVPSIVGDHDDNSIPLKNMTGIVADDWTDKIVTREQDTHIAFHYNGPNTEAPQCILLAVSPNDLHKWNEVSMRKVILDTLELTKLRAVNYKWVKELRHFLPTMLLNSYGENIFINLYKGDF